MRNAFREILPFLVYSALSLLLIFSNKTPQVESLRGFSGDAISFLLKPISYVIKVVSVYEDNKELRNYITELTLELSEIKESRIENKRLKEMLDFRSKSDHELIACDVISKTTDIGMSGIIVNRGADDGIQKNMPVINIHGIVGRVYRVTDRNSYIQLITDKNIGIAAMLETSREQGITRSTSKGKLLLDGIPVTSHINPKEKVISSGVGGIFPSGLSIGTVEAIAPAYEDWLWEVIVNPSVNFNKLEEVFILTSEK